MVPLVLGLFLTGCQSKVLAPRYEVKRGSVQPVIVDEGTLRSELEVKLISEVLGSFEGYRVKNGAKVTQGTLLAELDAKEAENRLVAAQASQELAALQVEKARSQLRIAQKTVTAQKLQSQAGLESSKQQLYKVQNGMRTEERSRLKSQLELAQTEYRLSQDNYRRQESLYQTGAISKVALEEAELRVSRSLSQLSQAEAQWQEAEQGSRQEDLDISRAAVADAQGRVLSAEASEVELEIFQLSIQDAVAQLQKARAQVAELKEALSSYRFIAPESGTVALELFQKGAVVQPGDVIGYITDPERLYVEVLIDEGERLGLTMGMNARIRLSQDDGLVSKGIVSYISPIAYAKQELKPQWQGDDDKVYRVFVTLSETPGPAWNTGGSCLTYFERDSVEDVLVIPRSAAFSREGQWYVLQRVDGEARRIAVELGAKDFTLVEVIQGLEAGDEIIALAGSVDEGQAIDWE